MPGKPDPDRPMTITAWQEAGFRVSSAALPVGGVHAQVGGVHAQGGGL